MSRLFVTLLIASALAGTVPAGAEVATFGYSNGTQGRKNVFSVKTATSGLALRLNPGKTALLEGRSITGIRVSFGSRNTSGKQADLFLAKDLGGSHLRESKVTISSANDWLDFYFDEPYVIGAGEGDLYVGYTVGVENMNYKPLSADFGDDMPEVGFVYDGEHWTDMNGSGRGMPNIFAILDEPVEFSDVIVKPFSGTGSYMRPGEGEKVKAALYNLGSTTVKSIEGVVVCKGNETPISLSDLDVAHGADFSFPLPEGYDTEAGTSEIMVRIDKVNGVADADPSDNSASDIVCFYPADNERGLMIDFFTGQGCPQCPGGHNTLHSTLSSLDMSDQVFYVAHHAGYYPDTMTSEMAMNLTAFYDGSTYAPSFTVNRMPGEQGNIISQISGNEIRSRIQAALDSEPFVSLDVKTEIDPATRELKLDADVYCFKEISDASQVAFNAFLVQDNITAYQSNGGSDYNHSNVDRLPLFESIWGKQCLLETGKTSNFSLTTVIPEKIRSDYWTDGNIQSLGASALPPVTSADLCTYDAPLDDLSLVVYVARHDNSSVSGHSIVNAMRLKLGESRRQAGFPENSGVRGIDGATPGCRIVVDGNMVRVEGECASLLAYTLAGQPVDVTTGLANGIYIVKAVSPEGAATVKKIIIR